MKFDFFLNNISKIEKIKVNAIQAHEEFSPEYRESFSEDFKTEKTRKASVMPIISPINGEAHLTLIVRAEYKGAHSGQVAFAGGKWEEDDASLLETAYREVEEEIGVSKNKLIFCRALTSLYIPVSDFRVYPFFAYATEPLNFIPQESEVAKIINLPIGNLFKDSSKEFIEIPLNENLKIKAPAFVNNGYSIWGATSMMLNELKQIIVKSME